MINQNKIYYYKYPTIYNNTKIKLKNIMKLKINQIKPNKKVHK